MMEQGHRQSLVKSAKGANVKLFDDASWPGNGNGGEGLVDPGGM